MCQYLDTLLLISQYKALESKIKKKKNLWSKIADVMQTNGYCYTADQCEFYSERPNVKPTYLVSRTRTFENLEESLEENSEEEEGRSKSPAPVPVPAKKKRSNISDVLDVLKVHIQSQSERHQENLQRQEQMHQERLTVMKGFLDVFKDMTK